MHFKAWIWTISKFTKRNIENHQQRWPRVRTQGNNMTAADNNEKWHHPTFSPLDAKFFRIYYPPLGCNRPQIGNALITFWSQICRIGVSATRSWNISRHCTVLILCFNYYFTSCSALQTISKPFTPTHINSDYMFLYLCWTATFCWSAQ